MTVLANHNAIESGGYTIANSLRLRSSASAYLSRTFGTPTSNTTWTWSGWIKRGALGVRQTIISAGANNTNFSEVYIDTDDKLWYRVVNSTVIGLINSNQVFRDPSGHFHLCLSKSGTTITAKVNGGSSAPGGYDVTWTVTTTITAGDTYINSAILHAIGARTTGIGVGFYLDGYLSDVYFIDGQALTPSSFGQTDSNGVWVPKAYTSTYGTNGFYLKFNDGSSTTNLCLDRSGNGNNWTPNNISVTAGATYDWMSDTPTNNYAVLNPLDKNASLTASDGNLAFQASAATAQGVRAAIAVPSGVKVYAECLFTTWTTGTNNYAQFGIATSTASLSSDIGNTAGTGFTIEANQLTNTILRLSGSSVTITGAVTSGDVFQVAVDLDSLKVWLGKNNTWYDSAGGTTGNPATGANATGTLASSVVYFPAALKFGTANAQAANFGQRPFSYSPPTGFKALCTQNLPAVTIANPKKHFDVLTWTGNSATRSITGLGFQPDLVWIKDRNTARSHRLFDAVRGATLAVQTDFAGAESTLATDLTAFLSDGFTLGAGLGSNGTGETYVGWNWKAGGTGVSNTSGTISSTVSANTAAGISVVTYTGNGSAGATIGHGLGTVPKMILTRNRDTTPSSWAVGHALLNGGTNPWNYWLNIDATAAQAANSAVWNNTAPTSSVFTVGIGTPVNENTKRMLAYVFSEVPGFSKFGQWVNNNSTDGSFIYCGFKPRFILLKNSDNIEEWYELDTARTTYNVAAPGGNWLRPNSSAAEVSAASPVTTVTIDVLSNGFKIRTTNPAAGEVSFGTRTYIFGAWADQPFGGSNVAPATAR